MHTQTRLARKATVCGLISVAGLMNVAVADADTGAVGHSSVTTTASATAKKRTVIDVAATTLSEAVEAPKEHVLQLPAADGWWKFRAVVSPSKNFTIRGQVSADLAGQRAILERKTDSGEWLRIRKATISTTGSFSTLWRAKSLRRHFLRLWVTGTERPTDTSGEFSDEAAPVSIAASGRATWFGPDDYGTVTACGFTLTTETIGVAHRTLPCGTQVEIRRNNKVIVVPVVDRGPYANGAVLDLTKNIADEIDVDGVNNVRYLPRNDLPKDAVASRRR